MFVETEQKPHRTLTLVFHFTSESFFDDVMRGIPGGKSNFYTWKNKVWLTQTHKHTVAISRKQYTVQTCGKD